MNQRATGSDLFEDFGEAEAMSRFASASAWLRGEYLHACTFPIDYSGPPVRMRVTGHQPDGASVVRDVFNPAFRVLEAMSQGKIVAEGLWGARVHSERAGVAALNANLTDLAPCYSGWDSDAYPMAQALRLPGLFGSPEIGTAVSQFLYDEFFRPDVERQGILMGRMKATGGFHLFTQRPVRSLADLAGMRIAANEGIESEVLAVLGAQPVALTSLEKKGALRSGAVDAIHLSDGAAEVFGIAELARYRIELGLVRNNTEYGMRLGFWRDLPPDLKPVLQAWLHAEAQAEAQIFYGLQGARARDQFRAGGMEFIRLSHKDYVEAREKLRPLRDAFAARMEHAGRPAKRLLDSLETCTARYAEKTADQLMREAACMPPTSP